MDERRRYLVTIYYREPSYERRQGGLIRLYRASYEVREESERRAIRRAKQSFDTTWKLSSVGWPRCIVRTNCWVLGPLPKEKGTETEVTVPEGYEPEAGADAPAS